MTPHFEVDKNSEECLRWVDYAHRALEYDFTMSESESQATITNVCQAVANEYGASPSAMEELTMYL